MKIKEIRAVTVELPSRIKTEGRREPWVRDDEVVNPMSKFPKYKRYRSSWMPKKWGPVWVQVIAEDGTYGLGQTAFGRLVAAVVDDHFGLIWQRTLASTASTIPPATTACSAMAWKSVIRYLIASPARPRLATTASTARSKLAGCRRTNACT